VRLPLRRPPKAAPANGAPALPDPSLPPSNRGRWEDAALTNVEITEVVKRNLRTVTRPWNK
jgi:hypothetical protein